MEKLYILLRAPVSGNWFFFLVAMTGAALWFALAWLLIEENPRNKKRPP